MASPATEILGPWPAANPAIRSLSHKQQAEHVRSLKDVGVGVVAHDFVIFDDVPNALDIVKGWQNKSGLIGRFHDIDKVPSVVIVTEAK